MAAVEGSHPRTHAGALIQQELFRTEIRDDRVEIAVAVDVAEIHLRAVRVVRQADGNASRSRR